MTENNMESFQDEIRVKGIRSLGYGQLAKIAMLDPDLSLEAKAIYAYFCSYTGSGHNNCFPSRDKIISDLNISKDRYYRYYSQLIKEGYITVEQKKEDDRSMRFTHNVYCIELFPSKYEQPAPSNLSEYHADAYRKIQAVKDIFAAGYGIIPKSVMLDDIPIEAKGIYAFYCTFTGQDYTAVPDADFTSYYCHIGHNACSKYIKSLFTHNYLSKKSCGVNGKFGKVVYYLNQNIPESSSSDDSKIIKTPYTYFKDTAFKDAVIKDTVFADTGDKDTVFQDKENKDSVFTDTKNTDTGIQDANIIINNKNNSNKNNLSLINQSKSFIKDSDKMGKDQNDGLTEKKDFEEIVEYILREKELPVIDSLESMISIIRYLTDWEYRCSDDFYIGTDSQFKSKIYKLFVESLAEMLLKGNITYVNGCRISSDRVNKYLSENYLEIINSFMDGECATLQDLPDEVCDRFIQAAKDRKITNVKSYIKSIIWTELETSGAKSIVDFLHSWNE